MKWEYNFTTLCCYTRPEDHAALLNEFAKQGWWIDHVLPGNFEEDDCVIAFIIFKREIPDDRIPGQSLKEERESLIEELRSRGIDEKLIEGASIRSLKRWANLKKADGSTRRKPPITTETSGC